MNFQGSNEGITYAWCIKWGKIRKKGYSECGKKGVISGPNISPQLSCCMSLCNNFHEYESKYGIVLCSWREEKL